MPSRQIDYNSKENQEKRERILNMSPEDFGIPVYNDYDYYMKKQAVDIDPESAQEIISKGAIGVLEAGEMFTEEYEGAYDNVYTDEMQRDNYILNMSENKYKRSVSVDNRLERDKKKKEERNKRVNEGTGSFFDRAGAALDRIGKDVYQSQVQYTNEQKEQRMPNKGNPDFKYTFAGVNHAGNIVYDEVDLRKKIGFIEGIDYGMQDGQYIPLAGGFIKGHAENRYRNIKDKIKNGEQINQKDYEFFNRRYEREREKTLRGFTVAGNIGQYLPNSLAFMAELAVPQLSIAKVGMAGKAAKISKGVTDFIAGANVVQKTGKLGAMGANTAGFITGRGLAAMGTAALAEVLPSGWGRIYATYHERRLNDEIKITDRGTLIFTEAKETPAKAFFKSLQSVYISYLSEGMGELIGAGVIKPAGYIAGKIVVNPLTKKNSKRGGKTICIHYGKFTRSF